MKKSFRALAQEILNTPCPHQTRLITVDGGAGAGKSTFSRLLANALDAPVIQIDDFLGWKDLESFWPRLEEEVWIPLFRGEEARYQIRDWAHDNEGTSLANEYKIVAPTPVVVFEGVTSSRQALDSRIHFRVWIDTPRDARLSRGLARDRDVPRASELWEAWMPFEAEFFRNDGAHLRQDLIVDGTEPYELGTFKVGGRLPVLF